MTRPVVAKAALAFVVSVTMTPPFALSAAVPNIVVPSIKVTVPVALAQFLNSDVAPWNYMMATAIVYALPPLIIYYSFRGRMTAGLTAGGVKG